MNAHTPGPWSLMTVPTSVGSCHKIGPFPNGDRVSTFACIYADGHRNGIDDANPAAQELAANARLIAAAPMLLEIVQTSIKNVRSLGPAGALASVHEPYSEWLSALEMAYSEATGGDK